MSTYALKVLSPTVLELSLVTTKNPDPAPVVQWNFVGDNFVPAIPASSKFVVTADAATVSVSQVGFKRRPLYAPLKTRDLRIGNCLYLVLAQPLSDGQTVTVKNPDGDLWNDATVAYTAVVDPFRYNPAIHVNQVGYLPAQSKKAMVGYYLGTLGEIAVRSPAFNIVDTQTRTIVYTGVLNRRADVGFSYSPAPYQQVFEADFTAFQSAGEYVLQVPGMGISLPFLINEGTAAAFARAYALGLYHQRCGAANALPFTRFEHDPCHVAPAEVPDMTFTSVNYQLASESSDYANNPLHTAPQLKDVNASLYPFINKGPIDVSMGHHDAGDYSKYTINSAALIHHLVFAADSFPGAGALDNLNLPESGDGKSDLLQEAKWEADFLSKMQDADGGFYFLVYPRNRVYEDDVLPDHGDPQVVFPKTTAVTAAAVGALAEIASSPTFKQQFPAEAAQYLAKAAKGWGFLTNAIARFGKNGSYQKITHYGNEFMHDDELAWAAAAMFIATGDQTYHEQLKAWYDPSDPNTRRWSWWRLFEGYGCAARAYAFAARSGRLSTADLDPVYLAKCETEIIAAGDDITRFAQQTAYGTSFPDPNKSFGNAGWYFSGERAFEIATASQLVAKPSYLPAIISNMNYEGGCNPINITYITGLGWQRQREIVHQYAQNDLRVLPPSGLPLGNIQGGFAYLDNYKQELGKLCFPPDGAATAPYPFYDRWGDSFNTTTEFVIVDQARGLGTMAFLMAQTGAAASPSVRVDARITGLPAVIPAQQPILANLSAPGLDLSQARIVWEAADQEPFIGAAFSFAAKNPGVQWVEVEAQLPDGTRVFARTNFTASFSVSTPPDAFLAAALPNSTDMAALYHLDGDTQDATGKNLPLTLAGNAMFDDMNLGWMSNRIGKALRFHDLGDKATVTIPGDLLYQSGLTGEIDLEAMVFVNAYKGYNLGAPRLLSLQQNWNASLEWMEDTYSGPHIRGGVQFDVIGAGLNPYLPLKEWRHLSIRISVSEYSVYIDGQLVSRVPANELAGWGNAPISLELGNFDGWIDEVVVRAKRLEAPVSPGAISGAAISATAVGLSWTDASPNEAGFRIYRSTDNLVFNECGEVASGVTSWADSGLLPFTQYYYAVTAFNAAGESVAVSTRVATPANVLTAPTGLIGVQEKNLLHIIWNSLPGAVGYNIKRGLSNSGPFLTVGTTTDSTGFFDANVVPGTTYYYSVSAFNSLGESPNCAAYVVKCITVPSAPSLLRLRQALPTQLTIMWRDTSVNEAGFVVERSLDGVTFSALAKVAANNSIFDDGSVTPGRIYYYRLRSFNAAGSSTYSNSISAATPLN